MKIFRRVVDAIAFSFGDRFQISARAKLAAVSSQDRDAKILVVIKRAKRRDERVGAVAIDGVAAMGAVDGDGEYGSVDFGEDGQLFHAAIVRRRSKSGKRMAQA